MGNRALRCFYLLTYLLTSFPFCRRVGSSFPDREYARAGGPVPWRALPWLGCDVVFSFSCVEALPRYATAVGLPHVAPRGRGESQVLGPLPDGRKRSRGAPWPGGAACSAQRRERDLRQLRGGGSCSGKAAGSRAACTVVGVRRAGAGVCGSFVPGVRGQARVLPALWISF